MFLPSEAGPAALVSGPDFPFDPDLIQHVSPVEWHNIVLYGEISLDPNKLWVRNP